MTKVVYNACYGGFGLSHAAIMRYAELAGIKLYPFKSVYENSKTIMVPYTGDGGDFLLHYCTTPEFSNDTYWSQYDFRGDRTNPLLVQVVEELGDKANGMCAKLRIVDLPPGTQYRIDEYDGNESVETRDGMDWSVA